MRDAFHEDLDKISDQLVTMTTMVATALERATTALLEGDRTVAESVIAADDDIDTLRREIDDLAVDLLARQQPVATDLRMVVTAMHMSSDIERMGDLARHIAKVARMAAPNLAIPDDMRPIIAEMAAVGQRLVKATGDAISSKDVYAAVEIGRIDDAMDELHKKVFTTLLDNWQHGMEAGVNATLLSRYYERFGDHAVAVADRIVYLVTGRYGNPDEGLSRDAR
ncbi:phosphate signaling complex protein PhoU [Dermacoccus nishinomiyaensis]|uniref:phosphate signaling complex protein PhoU n=1 Tax=Dermacoccus TaxID=57495 RepID=UPI000DFD37A2|nr:MULTISPECIES: phosphate signaling complex protein PhoU [Dermacoccus]MBO1759370.1 phosphate signaling complex protein PhoU [Dermacoccus sp. NHGro5]QQY24417.1 phosphate signaling complex protein PhoU [Dermacoccus nishinomiyaensis]TCJ92517.1 PhoU-like phosphate uptake regulator [Dermacoccus sp. SAI-028]STD20161.1 Phosphate transport system protein phoU homolog [Dermacoccus nishinomiyaensis]